MLIEDEGVKALDMDIDDLFKDPEESLPQDEPSNTSDEGKAKEPKSELTQNMIDRINEVKRKTEEETKDLIAKENGYESYAAMKKAKEDKLVREHGFDKEDVEKVLNPLLEQRLADDPRLKKLEEYERRERDIYINEKLAAINKTTGQSLKITDLPQDTIDLWGKGVDLEQAYYATQGKTLITKTVSQIQNGTLNHLAPGSGSGNVKSRGYTAEEKAMYAAILGQAGYSITDKELAQKTVVIKKEN